MTDVTSYTMSPDAVTTIAAASGAPLDLRVELLSDFLRSHDVTGLVEAFAQFIGLANSVVENNREMIEVILITEGGMYQQQAERANLPTILGALEGLRLASGLDISGACDGCAFRIGTPANQSVCTTSDASFCAEPGEIDFLCHVEGLDERGEPTRGCAGWAKMRAARKAAA